MNWFKNLQIKFPNQKPGFSGYTMVELLVVLTIITTLVTGSLIGGINLRRRAQADNLASRINQMRVAIVAYNADTGSVPHRCRRNTCDNGGDLMTDPGTVPGWNGPYLPEDFNFVSQWGGAIHFDGYSSTSNDSARCDCVNEPCNGYNADLQGRFDNMIIINDDPPTGAADSAAIPTEVLENIDASLDDGDLTTGLVRGNGDGFAFTSGTGADVYQLNNAIDNDCNGRPWIRGSETGELLILIPM